MRSAFATAVLGSTPDGLVRASEDASFRSYWRVRLGTRSWILMDAPPEREDCRPFLAVARRLRQAGLHPPTVFGQDLANGFLLLEDLGDVLFADRLTPDSADSLYGQALGVLARLAALDATGLPPYDEALLARELDLFPGWYVERQLGLPVDHGFRAWWEPLTETLVRTALAQPTVFVHRDFHCGNLMIRSGQPGILDFQDAVSGPLTYDLVSLLLDRYVTWPRPRLLAWAEQHRARVAPDVAPATWERWFDAMGLQRNLKIVGIFARLKLRDGKDRYLAWQPRFIGYLLATARRYEAFTPLAAFLERHASGAAS